MLNDIAEVRQRIQTDANNNRGEQPRYQRSPLLFRRVEFDREPEEAGDCFPLLIRRFAVEIAAARLVGDAFNFFHRE